MKSTSGHLPLAGWNGHPPPGVVEINPRLWFADSDGYRVIFNAWGDPLYRSAVDDKLTHRFVCVSLRQTKLATQQEIAAAFGHTEVTQRRWERRFERQGLAGLDDGKSTGRPRRVKTTQELLVRRWFDQGLSTAEMARMLGVGATTVARTLDRLGCKRKHQTTQDLAFDSTQSEVDDATPQEAPCGSGGEPHGDTAANEHGTPDDELLPLPCDAPLASDTVAETSPDVAAAGSRADGLPSSPCGDPLGSDTAAAIAVPSALCTPADQAARASCEASRVSGTVADATALVSGDVAAGPYALDLPVGTDPEDRSLDRLFARLGLIDDAAPMFATTERVDRAGVFLAVPLLVQSGLVEIFKSVYKSIGPAFYGLRTTVVCMYFLAILRIKRPENLKESDPAQLGRLLGLDRAPEVKTLRRKLALLGLDEQGAEVMRRLAASVAAQDEDRVGVLYVDGHVKEYHGKYDVGKTKITQRGLAAPASTDTWVNDIVGDPLFVVTSDVNAGLTKMLEPILAEVRRVVGSGREVTVIFDRGGWSPKLFRMLISQGFHVITYRKGKSRRRPQAAFETKTATINGRTYRYRLDDAARVRVGRSGRRDKGKGKYVWLRQVTRLRDDGNQTRVVTDRTDLPPAMVLFLMFNRWRQENFFKYMKEEYALDALLEYGADPVPVPLDRPNPKRRAVEKKLRKAVAEVAAIESALGADLADNDESRRPTARGIKIANASLLRELRKARAKVQRLAARRAALPKRVPVLDRKRLRKQRRLVVDAVKMVAYRVEGRLLEMLRSMYARAEDDGRTFLQAAFQSAGSLQVSDTDLTVTLAPQSSPHRTQALTQLCERLNALGTTFPGTKLRLRLAVEAPKPII